MNKKIALRMLIWGAIPLGVVSAVVVGFIVTALSLGGTQSPAMLLAANAIAFTIAFALIISVDSLLRKRTTSKRDFGLTHSLRWKDFAYGIGGMVLYLLVAMAVLAAGKILLPGVNWEQSQELGVQRGIMGVDRMMVFVALVVVAPVVEELVFRGFLYTRLRQAKMPLWVTMVVVSVVFGLVHMQVNVGVDVFVLSMVACVLRHLTDSVWPGILIHMTKNLLAFYVIFVLAP